MRVRGWMAVVHGLAAVVSWGCTLGAASLDERATAPTRVAIESVTVVDVEGGTDGGVVSRRLPDHRVVFSGDEIVWVGPMSVPGPAVGRVIDGRGGFLIPGLWDAHVHFLYDETLTEAMPGLFVHWGITSVRDTGGDLERLVGLRERWGADPEPEPRIFVSGPLLDGRHVVYDGEMQAQPPLGTRVPDVAAARVRVRALKEGGADFIKIYEMVSPEVFSALVETAREEGLPIASHVPLSLTADVAGPRVDSMEHLRNVELACARDADRLHRERLVALATWDGPRGYPLRRALHDSQRLAAIADFDPERCRHVLARLRRTLQVPTLRLNAYARSRPDRERVWQAGLGALPSDVQERWRQTAADYADPEREWDFRFADWSLSLIGRMRAAGVPIGAGTDTPIRLAIPGESLHRELELLVDSGLTPAEALAAATRAPARFLGLHESMGRVEVGMAADLVLLDEDPLEDISNTRSIRGVVSRGRWRAREAVTP